MKCHGSLQSLIPNPQSLISHTPRTGAEPLDLPAGTEVQPGGGTVRLQPRGPFGQFRGGDALRHQPHPAAVDFGKLGQISLHFAAVLRAIDHELQLIIVLGQQAANDPRGVPRRLVTDGPARDSPAASASSSTSFGLIDIRSQATGR